MPEAEAQRHFDWFVGVEEERIGVLQEAFLSTTGEALEVCRNSLKSLWKWVAPHVAVERSAELEVASVRSAAISDRRLTAGTLCLAVDVGFFLARIAQDLHSEVTWHLWDRTQDYYYQRPVLIGFGRWPVVPHDPVIANFWKVIHQKTCEDALTKSLMVWEKKLK